MTEKEKNIHKIMNDIKKRKQFARSIKYNPRLDYIYDILNNYNSYHWYFVKRSK